jgi:hypothetical protein
VAGFVVVDNKNKQTKKKKKKKNSTVDCSDCVSNCLECEPGPWWELHFFASKPSDSSFGMFGIYYIFPANKTFVQLNYTISVPDLLQPSLNLEANWNGDLN